MQWLYIEFYIFYQIKVLDLDNLGHFRTVKPACLVQTSTLIKYYINMAIMGKILSLNFRRILSDNIKTNVKCIFPLFKNIA